MALVLADRVRETTTVTGTGTATLLGAVSGYQSFSAVGNANTTYYVIANQSASEWEVGIGTYTASGTLLSRTTVLSSSNSGSLVNFSAGTKDVFVDYPASKAVYEDASGNIDSYPITGGTINGTTVGATTPAAGTFTTLTAQTEVLKGTGQNLLLYSEQFDNAYWSKSNATITANSTTAPDGNVTADSLIENSATAEHALTQNAGTTIAANTPHIVSWYVKASTRTKGTIKYVLNTFANQIAADFDLTAGTISSAYVALGSGSTNLVSSILNVGNGWYRVSVGAIIDSSSTSVRSQILLNNGTTTFYTGNGTSGFFIWGAQLEIGSTANTYIPTTTTAVYGTPTLSFSGVSTIGLESNGSLFVQPAGTGALQAQATTSSAVGGNARGANAVDLQTLRDFAVKVASGAGSVLVGGQYNQASGGQSVTVGGNNVVTSGSKAASVGGDTNTNAAQLAFLGGGYTQTLSSNGQFGFLGGGYANTLAGFYNVIGGGYTNSGTSGSAVTTQSATMNGTTAVTLSGSNANIKVGQLITGTSINSFPNTYVASISGTSLTLSQVASGSSTSTLSFFTPHGVVVGGGNNQATGSYSFIGGGGDAGTAANRNVASGDWSSVLGGTSTRATGKWSTAVGGGGNLASGEAAVVVGGGSFGGGLAGNTASSTSSFVGAGYGNTANGYCSTVVGGTGNVASNNFSFVGGGAGNSANTAGASILGGYSGTTRSIEGMQVMPACIQPITTTQGASQAALLILGRQTTDATATVLTSNTSAASTNNQVILPNNSAYFFKGEVVAGVTGGGNTKGWTIEGVIKRGANAASTTVVGVTVMSSYGDAGAVTWTIAAAADTTNGGLKITATGQAATTIRWVCKIETTEMTF